MNKIYSLLTLVALGATMNGQQLLFSGADFENWETFKETTGNSIHTSAIQGVGEGYQGSNSLSFNFTNGNRSGYIFSVKAKRNYITIRQITFWIKGTSTKSLSINVYNNGSTANNNFTVFNLGTISNENVTISYANGNSYSGTIDTQGQWVKVTLDTSTITNFPTDITNDLFALKMGSKAVMDIDIDNIEVVDAVLGTEDLKINSSSFIKNTLVTNELHFSVNSDIKIFNTNGQVVVSAKVTENTPLFVGNLASGVYFVTGIVNGKSVSTKFIKK